MLPGQSLNSSDSLPLYRHLYEHLRASILGGQVSAGSRLPSTRALAAEMGISRNTVLAAFEQLHAEGYLEGRLGSGTYVARKLPTSCSQQDRRHRQPPGNSRRRLGASGRSDGCRSVGSGSPLGRALRFRP